MVSSPTPIGTQRIRPATADKKGKRGIAFVVEALILLFFLVLFIALFVQLLGGATLRGQKAAELNDAVQIAEDTAEMFAANPLSLQRDDHKGAYLIHTEIDSEEGTHGTLYHVDITVTKDGYAEPIYELESARFVEQAAGAEGAGAQAHSADGQAQGTDAQTNGADAQGGEHRG